MNMSLETIKHAAVMADNGWIFIGKCHADCFHKMANINLKPYHSSKGQGFVTSKGRFVFRDKALLIAKNAMQVHEDKKKFLFSEDMWCDRDGGKYDYDEIEGYILKDKEKPCSK